jgi:hypothetical protein
LPGPVGLGRGPGEKKRGEEGMGRPGIGLAGRIRGKVKAGKEFVFPFSNLIFQITFPIDFQILSKKIYQNHSSQKYLCNSMHA